MLEKRSGEPTTLQNPAQWFYDFLTGGGKSATGVSVNEHTAMYNATVFACVRIISETIASLPLHVYKRLVDTGGKVRAPDHPLYSVLHDIANDEMSAFTFWETIMGHVPLWGNGYAEIERDGAGRVIGLWPLLPHNTMMIRSQRDGQLYYQTIIPKTNEQVMLPAYRVLHIPGLAFDGLTGYSVIRMAREAVGLAMATEEYGARFFGNGARPGGVLEHPGKPSENARTNLRTSWNEMHGGLSNQHRIALLEEGITYKQIGIPPEDAQFLQTRKYQKHEIAQIFRIPPHMLAELERSTHNNIEQQSIEFVTHTIRPWLVRIEKAMLMKLFTPSERKAFFAEFNVDGLLRGDIFSRYQALQIARQNGIINADEWRQMENMNPQPDGQGQIYLANSAMKPVDMLGKAQQQVKGGDQIGEEDGATSL